MTRRKPILISIASEETISFLKCFNGGNPELLASIPLETFLEGSGSAARLPRAVSQSVHQLLVIPDYWMGNRFDEFQANKKSVITAFIERKLKLEQPTLTEAADFYNYAVVQDQDHRQKLYTVYLQDAVAYQLYRRLADLGISPRQITTPALMWQNKLNDLADGFGEKGVGFIYLTETDCFFYLYFKGQFLFSRMIQLPETVDDPSQIYDLLNYEVNQTFYLYSQKTKSTVDTLYMLSPDSGAALQLTELLGREVLGFPDLPTPSGISEDGILPPACRGFTVDDLIRTNGSAISYKPLKKELHWRPVQWAGMAVGLVLAVLLTVESGLLFSWSAAADRQLHALRSVSVDPPEMVLQELSLALDEVSQALQRPSGSGSFMKTLMAMPDEVSVENFALDMSGTPQLSISAVVHADNPDTFKMVLKSFIDRLNARFDLKFKSLQEKDVRIHLDRRKENERTPVYLINLSFELSS